MSGGAKMRCLPQQQQTDVSTIYERSSSCCESCGTDAPKHTRTPCGVCTRPVSADSAGRSLVSIVPSVACGGSHFVVFDSLERGPSIRETHTDGRVPLQRERVCLRDLNSRPHLPRHGLCEPCMRLPAPRKIDSQVFSFPQEHSLASPSQLVSFSMLACLCLLHTFTHNNCMIV